MTKDWSDELGAALASGDPEYMRAVIARVPPAIVHQANRLVEQMARARLKDGKPGEALAYFDQMIALSPHNSDARLERARIFLQLERPADALADARWLTEAAPERADGFILMGEAQERLGERAPAREAFRRALERAPGDRDLAARLERLDNGLRVDAMLERALHPDAADAPADAAAPRPRASFDPALLDDPSVPEATGQFRIDGLRNHLSRYGNQQSPKHTIARLEDPMWLQAWDTALSGLAGRRALFHGSELGVFGLRALRHGAAHALCAESFALDARITAGMIQKHFLGPWQERHGAEMQARSVEERRASFDAFVQGIDIAGPEWRPQQDETYDTLVFPRIDHSLLGTGIVKAVERHRAGGAGVPRVMPARAALFAMAIQWAYPSAEGPMPELDRMRWSLSAQPLELDERFWDALTTPVRIAQIDFADFAPQAFEVALPVVRAGQAHAIVYWFELDLGGATVSNAPGGGLRCIKPAVQYTDPIAVAAGERLPLTIRIEDTRLYVQTRPAPTRPQHASVPAWFVPTLGDRARNNAYALAIAAAQTARPVRTALNIGAGIGRLATLAARAGVERVVGNETHPALCAAAQDAIGRAGLAHRITLSNADCRDLRMPEDPAERADLAVFDAFDCSLIGEGVLHFLAHAREHLLSDTARFVPAAARLRAMLIEYRLDRILGVDANLLNPYRFSPAFINVDADTLPYRALSAAFDVFAFDFSTDGPAPAEKECTVPSLAEGTVGAVLFWFDLRMDDDGEWIGNAPHGGDGLAWKQGLQFLPEVRVSPGMQLPLSARHDGSQLRFQWRADALPQDALSNLPRFDPRWVAASQALEQQTRDLLQHCAQNPDEFAKVADLAMRFAIDPAAHDLDPLIAQRFAAMMLGH